MPPMGRPRASGNPPRVTAKDARRRVLASTTGAVGGGGLAAFAAKLPEPYRQILVVFAPTISIVVAKYGPSILDASARVVRYLADWVVHQASILTLRLFLANQRKRLKHADLPEQRQEEIKRRISEAVAEIDDREYLRITPFLVGDNQSGLRVRAAEANSPPPTPGDDPDA